MLPDAIVVRAARRHRIAAVGGGRRRHDRTPAPLQLRAGGARRRQHRLGAVRRHLRHRHRSRAPRPTSAPARAGRSRACCIRSSCCCSCWSRRRSRATSRWPRWPPCSPWSPGTWRRSTNSRRCCARRWGDAVVLLATFLLTIFRDLTEGIVVGFALGAVLFIHRMAEMTGIEERSPLVAADRPDDGNGERVPYDPALAIDPRRPGLSHHRRVLLRRGLGDRQRARRHRRPAQGSSWSISPRCRSWIRPPPTCSAASPPRRTATASGCSSPARRPRFAARCSPMA